MSESKRKNLRVAAIQMICEEGKVDKNLEHASDMVNIAVKKGAKLVLLPELMPSGYLATEGIWDLAETINGKSVKWLRETAKEHRIHLGFTFLEADEENFYNAFVLATPEGKIAGRVRKSPAASIEANFYKAGDDLHVIETELGRIGVSICYENLLYERIIELANHSVDLVLSPSAAGRPKAILPGDVKRFEDMFKRIRSLYSDVLGVPNVTANRVGPLETELPGMLPYLKSSFPGLSSITDSKGSVLASLGDKEGVIVEDVELCSIKDKKVLPKLYGEIWAIPVPWYSFLWPMTQKTGEKKYNSNPQRPLKALSKSC